MTRLRVTKEQRRACEACSAYTDTLLIEMGGQGKQLRICRHCLDRIGNVRRRVENEGLDALEVW
jgi:hypothetical protein